MGGVNDLTIRKEARARLNDLVERAERATGSKMAAYEMVGQQIGRCGVWVRHFCRDYATAKLDCTVLNIGEAYRRGINADGITDGHVTRSHRATDAASRNGEAGNPVIAAIARLARTDPAYREAIVIIRTHQQSSQGQ